MIHYELEGKPVVIFRGDDTNFPGNAALTIQISTTEEVDFSALSAKFELLSIKKEFETIPENGLLYLEFSHEETKVLPPGSAYGVFRLIEKSTQKVRTIDDTLKFIITDCTRCAYPPKPDENFITVQFDSKMVVDWDSVKNKPTSYPTTWNNVSGKPPLVKTVNGIAPDGNGNIEVESGGVAELLTPITHAELVRLRNDSGLTLGMQYRITDYVATTVQWNTQSANHPFDIIVTADSTNKLNEVARAIRHQGDTYFPEPTKFEAWKIWYSLDNDTDRFEWADEWNGKGVVYRMIDEFDNDVPYDFKGIKIQPFLGNYNYSKDFVYTFGGISNDDSFYGSYSNHIGEYLNYGKRRINIITFVSGCYGNTFGSGCSDITIGSGCYGNTFGSGCYYIYFGTYCYNNTFGSGCSSNDFGAYCSDNTFGSISRYNTFGAYCSDNTFGSGCYGNTFGEECRYNTFGSSCTANNFGPYCSSNSFDSNCSYNYFQRGCTANSFGSTCSSNAFGAYCSDNTFGSTCTGNILFDFYSAITLQNQINGNTIDCTKDRGEFEFCKNIEIKSGVNNKEIIIDDVEQSYNTEIRPANSITITV